MNVGAASRRAIDLRQLQPGGAYYFLISAVVPRPIAWVSTLAADGSSNLAPFSFFQGVSADPPIVMISIAPKTPGTPKDTLRNLRDTGAFVVNLVPEEALEPMVASAAQLPHGESEIDHLGLATYPGTATGVPCLEISPASLECRVHSEVEVGSSIAVFGEVVLVHVREEVLDPRGNIDPSRLRPVGRLGGSLYTMHRETAVVKVR